MIVAAPGHEVERLVTDLLPLLSYSAPFAIYHQYLDVSKYFLMLILKHATCELNFIWFIAFMLEFVLSRILIKVSGKQHRASFSCLRLLTCVVEKSHVCFFLSLVCSSMKYVIVPYFFVYIFMQPLAKCMHSLQVSKMAIGLQLSEPWLREYQVSTLNIEELI